MILLNDAPALAPLLARGALFSPFKRPRSGAAFPRTRLVLPGVRVDLARLAAYERVCGFPAPGDDALPLTYPHVLGFPLAMSLMSGRDFPLPLLGLVHTTLAVSRYATLPATGTYDISVYVDQLASHRRGTQATVVTQMERDGELVWESSSTYLSRHHRPAAPADGDSAAPPLPALRRTLPTRAEWRLGADLGRRYGAVSGDRNPIHLHPLTARPFGFRRPIAHGMWTVARCLAAHGTAEAVRVRAEFRAPVPLPGVVRYTADDEGRFELRGGERVHLTGYVN
ncbi:MaoC/PaaZ C-terminal domain-containing protein [Streptomyces sp. NPDC006997]|uniref:MaoC family dehydratase n=1 Tax=Streptomyces sp. NPDC006997 TaxID=3155356 RepID=UPI0033EABD3A